MIYKNLSTKGEYKIFIFIHKKVFVHQLVIMKTKIIGHYNNAINNVEMFNKNIQKMRKNKDECEMQQQWGW